MDAKPAIIFEQIQSLCRDFRRQLKKNAPSRIEDYLDGVDESTRGMLFQNLLHIDIEFRRRQQQDPSSDEYIRRFPDYAALIRNAFFESTLMSRSPLVDTPSNQEMPLREMPVLELPAACRLGEFELLMELGRGNFGVVYEARHIHRNDVVALKTLPTSLTESHGTQDAERLHGFKREFRSLAGISHPNLVGLHSLECDAGQWYFTMDLVRGTDFLSYVRPNGEVDEARLRPAMSQLVAGVLALHANYVIHRDLKPSNVMVADDGRVLLLDFGLAVEQQGAASAETIRGIAGTPAYMAPEQAIGDTVTTASDWYAVGTMLYEALCGQRPFTGPALRILQDKQREPAPRLPRGNEIPDDLANLSEALLSTRADDRPRPVQIAAAVASSGVASVTASSQQPGQLIGRETQLRTLQSLVDEFVTTSRPMAAFVDGRSGEGKTALCQEFLDSARRQVDFTILSGRCYDRESVPFKALDSAIDAVCTYLNGQTPAAIESVLPRDIRVLQHMFPVFGRLKEIRAAGSINVDQISEQEIRNRAILALRELLGRIGDRNPVILFVDDLQWGDVDSAEVLLQILREPNAPRILFLGTYRTDEADDSRFLQAWRATAKQLQIEVKTESISVGPLTVDQCEQLMIQAHGAKTESIRRRATEFCEQTGGNAYLLTELIGCFDHEADSFRQIPVNEVIHEKLERLPEEATRLLELISASGQALNAQELSVAANSDSVPMSILTRMRTARLIRFVGQSDTPTVDTYHDRIRESVLSELPATQLRQFHRQLAVAIEAIDGGLSEEQLRAVEQGDFELDGEAIPARLFDLAFHFEAAGEYRKVFAYSVLAAEQARRQFSLETAVPRYQTARRFSDHASQNARFLLLLKLGESLRLLGQYDEAESTLNDAHGLVADKLERCEVERIHAETIRESGRYQESADRFAATLQSLGVAVPKSVSRCLLGIAKEGIIQAVQSFRKSRPRRNRPSNPRQELIVRLLSGYVQTIWFRSTPAVVWTNLKVLNQVEGTASPESCVCWGQHGLVCMLLGLEKRGARYFQRAVQMTSEEDFGTQIRTSLYGAVAGYCLSRFRETCEHSSRGLELVDRNGESWIGLLLKLHQLLAEYRLGNVETALRGALDAFLESVRMGDPNTAHDYVNFVALMTGGRFRFPEMRAALTPIPDNIQATNQILQAEARWHLFHDRPREAYEQADAAFQLMKTHLVINHMTNTTFPLLLEATRRYAASLQQVDPVKAKSLLKQGFSRAKWAERITRVDAAYPAVLRELGQYHFLRGNLRKAIRATQKSCQVAEQREMSYERTLSRLAVIQLQMSSGQANFEELKAEEAVLLDVQQRVSQIIENMHDRGRGEALRCIGSDVRQP